MAPATRHSDASGNEVAYHDDDAALARALQEEYEREYRRRSMQQHLGGGGGQQQRPQQLGAVEFAPAFPTAPTGSFASGEDGFGSDPFYSPNSQDTGNSFNAFGEEDVYQEIEVSDEAFARQLEQQMLEEALQRQQRRQEAEGRRLAAERGAATANRAKAPARSNSTQRLPPTRDHSMSAPRVAPSSRDNSFRQQRSSPPSRDNSLRQQRSSRSLNRNNSSSNINSAAAAAAASRARSRSRNPPSRDNSLNRGGAANPRPRSRSRNPPPSRENSLRRVQSQSRLAASSRSHSQRSLHNNSERSRTAPTRSGSAAARRPPSRSNSSASQRYNNNSSNRLVMAPGAVAPVTMHDFQVLSDEELAKRLEEEEREARIEQEERDAEVARQWLVEEQIRRSAEEAQRLAHPERKCGTCRRLFSFLVALLVIAAGVTLLLIFLGKADAVGDVFIPDPQGFREEDPFSNANPEDANAWPASGQGLKLTVINAMEEHWHEFFDTAVSQWDSGTPDALTLTVEYEEAQSVCREQRGALKVCNGNYGDTNWRGINKVLLENGEIYSSAARMNEFYLTRNYEKDFYQMAYTVCHEMGHGFGLPHTDENFFNKNLGNCMDYTNDPESNAQPNTPNFNLLAQLYGTVDGSPVPEFDNGQTVEAAETANDDKKNKDGGRRRKLRQPSPPVARPVPASVAEASDNVDQLVNSKSNDLQGMKGWRKLHESEHREAHEIDAGDGFTIQIHMLKYVPPQ